MEIIESAYEDDDDYMVCVNCSGKEAPIFLCEAGWWCEDCYRRVGGVPTAISSEELHDAVGGDLLGYNEAIKEIVFSDDDMWSPDGEASEETEEAESSVRPQ